MEKIEKSSVVPGCEVEQSRIKIKDLAEQDRPREKLIMMGERSLTNSELLGIIIGSGQVNRSAVDIAREILGRYNNNLTDLGNTSLKELTKIKGIGVARAINIIAALELGRRRNITKAEEKMKITDSRDAYMIFHPRIADLKHEEMWILMLNRQNQMIGVELLSEGGLNGTVVDVRMAIKMALDMSASAIMIAHNHPSGTLKPSKMDDDVTRKLYEAGKLMDIPLRDHIIIVQDGLDSNRYYSYFDNDRIIGS